MTDKRQAPGLAARQTAVNWLAHCLRQRVPLDEVIQDPDMGTELLAPRDRNFARHIVLTTLRRLTQIDQVLDRFLSRGIPRKSGKLREILQTGTAQLLFMNMPAHAVVDCAIRLARKDRNARHLKNLANAVLRNIDRERDDLIELVSDGTTNTPDWLWQSWVLAYGADTAKAIALAHLDHAPLDLTVKQNPAEWAKRLEGIVLPTGSVRLMKSGPVPDLSGFDEGEWWVQDAAAAIPAQLFDKLKGKDIVDMCAAPGGKTAQLAHAGANVTAVDISDSRLNRLRDNLARLQLRAQLIKSNALHWQPGETFDAVLLDAPCSSTGTIRRHPDVQRLKKPDSISSLMPLQADLLKKAYSLLNPGGQLVYCVCSLQKEEGENQINAFLDTHSDMQRSPAKLHHLGLPDSAATEHGDLRLRPDLFAQHGGMDGFFISVLNRNI